MAADRAIDDEVALDPYSHVVVAFYALGSAALTVDMGDASVNTTGSAGWNYREVELASAALGETVDEISVRNTGGATVLVTELYLANINTAKWGEGVFHVVRGTGELEFSRFYGPQVLRLEGAKRFARLTSDTAESALPPEYVTNKATALALVGLGVEDPDNRLGAFYLQMANRELRAVPRIQNLVAVK